MYCELFYTIHVHNFHTLFYFISKKIIYFLISEKSEIFYVGINQQLIIHFQIIMTCIWYYSIILTFAIVYKKKKKLKI